MTSRDHNATSYSTETKEMGVLLIVVIMQRS